MDTCQNNASGAYSDRVKILCSFFLVTLIFIFYTLFVVKFGVNVPYWDEWELIDVFQKIYSNQKNWWDYIFIKHNEHLMGVPFVLNILQLLWTNANSKTLIVTGVIIQGLSFTIFSFILLEEIPKKKRALWLVLASLICFSLSQYKNLLWAFQTAWFLVTFLLAVTLACLHHSYKLEVLNLGRGWLALAIIAAVLASFTSFQGTIVWFAGAFYLFGLQSYRFDNFFTSITPRIWIAAALLAGICFVTVWCMNFGVAHGGNFSIFSIFSIFYIFFGIHGTFFGDGGVFGVAIFGFVMVCFILLSLAKVFLSANKRIYALPVSMIVFGVFFVALISIGRAKFGIGAARDPHYNAYTLISYVGVLSIFMTTDPVVIRRKFLKVGNFLLPSIIVIATFASTYDAVLHGIDWRESQGIAAEALLGYKGQSDLLLTNLVYGDAVLVKRLAEFMETNQLGVFGDPKAIPHSVELFMHAPESIENLIAIHQDQQNAIQRAWQVYLIGNDLRRAFNPLSKNFAFTLIQWCYSASKNNDHYLSEYLHQYAADYAYLYKILKTP
jgi:hypothetical protein